MNKEGGKDTRNPMNIEVEIRDIKKRVIEISEKIDNLMSPFGDGGNPSP